MGSTFPSLTPLVRQDRTPPADVGWRSWPLVDHASWSWAVVLAILAVAGVIVLVGGSWLLAAAAAGGFCVSLWQFFVPVRYEAGPHGIRRSTLGRTQLVPWHAVRAYQLRTTGVVLYQQAEPIKVDLLRSLFLPYPLEEEELICALRQHLTHAVELPP